MDEDARWLATALLKIGAVSFSPEIPVTWTSGLSAPVYCDVRLTIAYPQIRSRICDMFADRVRRANLHPQVIAGTASAGIPHAAWLADRMDLPLVYVRGAAKAHGQSKQVEGHAVSGQACVLVEDTISTGGSLVGAARALADEGLAVTAAMAIHSYGFQMALRKIEESNLRVFTLLTFQTLLNVAEQVGEISRQSARMLEEWRSDPEAWSATYRDRITEKT